MAALRRHRKGDGQVATAATVADATPVATAAEVPEQRLAVNGGTPVAVETAPAPGRRLGDMLVSHGLLTKAGLAPALEEQLATGARLGRVLVASGVITDEDLARLLAEQMNLPLADLRTTEPDTDALEMLSESVARASLALPLRVDDGRLTVAVAEPEPDLAAKLARAAGVPVSLLVSPRADVEQALNRHYRALDDITKFVKEFETTGRAAAGAPVTETTAQIDSPVVRVVNLVVTQALRDRASDIHIEPQDDRLRIRYRIDGALHDVLSLPNDMSAAFVSRLKIMAGMNIVERRRPQDGQLQMTIDGREVDIRMASVGVHWGEKVVLRLLDKSRTLLKLNDLGMPPATHEAFSKLIHAPFGMVICAGPTGSGRTTTLYAALSEINESQRNIMTIEDPIEYVFPSINQIQTNEAAGLTFATGLKSILRQDPDVILVGESRDIDTARIAVQSALTGHLVLSSLHATDAVAALHRFLDMGIESFLVASSVLAVVGQRLVRRICTGCKAPVKPTPEELAFYAESGGKPKRVWYAGTGCHLCAGTGFQGRIGVYELLRISPEIKRLIVGWATQDELRNMAVSQGMRTLRDEALGLIEDNVTTIGEVVRSIYAF